MQKEEFGRLSEDFLDSQIGIGNRSKSKGFGFPFVHNGHSMHTLEMHFFSRSKIDKTKEKQKQDFWSSSQWEFGGYLEDY